MVIGLKIKFECNICSTQTIELFSAKNIQELKRINTHGCLCGNKRNFKIVGFEEIHLRIEEVPKEDEKEKINDI